MRKLEIVNLSKYYKTSKGDLFYAIRDIYLSFNSAGLVSIIGKSGSGKSTLLNMIAKIDSPSSGYISLDGKDINKNIKKDFYNRKVGILFQNYNLLEDNDVLFNVVLPLAILGYSKKEAKVRAKDVLKSVGILEGKFYQKVATLSGGEKQRVALARSIVESPEILLCDEPTGALDTANSEIIMELLKKISENTLVIVVSHNLQLVNKYSDRIILLSNGRVVDDKYYKKTNSLPFRVRKKKPKRAFWKDSLTFSNFKKRIKGNIFSSTALMFAITFFLLAFGFNSSKEEAIEKETYVQYDYGVGTISKEEKIASGSLITLTRDSRPYLEELNKIKSIKDNYKIGLNLDMFFPQNSVIYDKNNIEYEVTLSPVYDIQDKIQSSIIQLGETDITFPVVINNFFKDKYDFDRLDNHQLYTEINSVISFYEDDVQIDDLITIKIVFEVIDAVEDLNFLSEPKIYYPYSELEHLFSNYILSKISTYKNEEVTLFSFLSNLDNNSPYTCYSYRLFPLQKGFFLSDEELENANLVFTSPSLLKETTLKGFFDVAQYGIDVFVGISALGTLMIIGLVSFSNYSFDKKNVAILKSIGAKRSDISEIYFHENLITFSMGLFFSIPLALGLSAIANLMIEKYMHISNVINIPFLKMANIPFLLPFIMTIGLGVICFVMSKLPIYVNGNVSIKDELTAL